MLSIVSQRLGVRKHFVPNRSGITLWRTSWHRGIVWAAGAMVEATAATQAAACAGKHTHIVVGPTDISSELLTFAPENATGSDDPHLTLFMACVPSIPPTRDHLVRGSSLSRHPEATVLLCHLPT